MDFLFRSWLMDELVFFFLVSTRFRQHRHTWAAVVQGYCVPQTILVWKRPFWKGDSDLETGISLPLRLHALIKQITHCRQDGGAFFGKISFLRGEAMKYEKKKMNNKTTSEHFDKNIKILIPVASYDQKHQPVTIIWFHLAVFNVATSPSCWWGVWTLEPCVQDGVPAASAAPPYPAFHPAVM